MQLWQCTGSPYSFAGTPVSDTNQVDLLSVCLIASPPKVCLLDPTVILARLTADRGICATTAAAALGHAHSNGPCCRLLLMCMLMVTCAASTLCIWATVNK
jgi:hypothetical protein